MRRWGLAAVVATMAQGALAADLPDLSDLPVLRGPITELSSTSVNWQGFYIGGQGAMGSSDMDFSGATRDIAAALLSGTAIEAAGNVSTWPVLGKVSKTGHGWGGFVGYNAQWDDVVLSLEASYIHGSFGGSQTNSMSRSFVDSLGYTDGVTYTSTATNNITDMGSIRGRAGWAWNNFLPYGFVGVALGRADVTRSATISGVQVNPSAAAGFTNIPFSLSQSAGQSGRLIYGYAGGLGMDVLLVGGLFGRVEWEYLRFLGGGGTIDTTINTARVGLGYKF